MRLRKKVTSVWRPGPDTDFWLDLVLSGSLKPSEFLSGQNLTDVNKAIEVLISFECAIYNHHEKEDTYG